jgi:hypothetical protein
MRTSLIVIAFVVLAIFAAGTAVTYQAVWKVWRATPSDLQRRIIVWALVLFPIGAAGLALLIIAPQDTKHTRSTRYQGRLEEAQPRLDELVAIEPTELNRWIRRGARRSSLRERLTTISQDERLRGRPRDCRLLLGCVLRAKLPARDIGVDERVASSIEVSEASPSRRPRRPFSSVESGARRLRGAEDLS